MNYLQILYKAHLNASDNTAQQLCTGGKAKRDLTQFLRSKLTADDYSLVEPLINDFGADMERTGFRAGARSILSLCVDVLENK